MTYLQYTTRPGDSDLSLDENKSLSSVGAYKVMPYDNLFIRVITPDPQWASIFNMMPVGEGGAITEESASLFGYPVDAEGYIEIPYVGQVEVAGQTLSDIKVNLDSIFKNYVTDAAIKVRLVNNYISILGEVSAPGRYRLTKDQLNVFEAIAMAGDLSVHSNRQRVQLIRPSSYGPVVKEFSLTDRSIMSSEFYYLKPNDIIYAMPMQSKTFQLNSSVWSLLLTTITSAFGIIALVRTL